MNTTAPYTTTADQLGHGDLYRQARQTTIGQGDLVLIGSLADLLSYAGEDADDYEPTVYRQIGSDEDAYREVVAR